MYDSFCLTLFLQLFSKWLKQLSWKSNRDTWSFEFRLFSCHIPLKRKCASNTMRVTRVINSVGIAYLLARWKNLRWIAASICRSKSVPFFKNWCKFASWYAVICLSVHPFSWHIDWRPLIAIVGLSVIFCNNLIKWLFMSTLSNFRRRYRILFCRRCQKDGRHSQLGSCKILTRVEFCSWLFIRGWTEISWGRGWSNAYISFQMKGCLLLCVKILVIRWVDIAVLSW